MNIAAGIYRVLRAVLVTVISCAVGIPAILYIALSLPGVQGEVRDISQRELSNLLSTEVSIGDLAFSPFNRVTLFDVRIADDNGQNAVTVSRLGTGISLVDLIFRGKFVVTYAEIIGFDGHISREDNDSPLNIANIIKKFTSDDKNRRKTKIELSINTIVLRQCSFDYNVLSAPYIDQDRFDKKHIALTGLNADITIPVLSDGAFDAELFRITFAEKAGLKINDLHGKFTMLSDTLSVSNLAITLPGTDLHFEDITIPLDSMPQWRDALSRHPLNLRLSPQSYINPSDFSPFSPMLSDLDSRFNIVLDVTATDTNILLDRLSMRSTSPYMQINASGTASDFISADSLDIDIKNLSIVAMGSDIRRVLRDKVPQNAPWLENLGLTSLKGSASYIDRNYSITLNATTQSGKADISLKGAVASSESKFMPLKVKSKIQWTDVELGNLLADGRLGRTNGEFISDLTIISPTALKGNAALTVGSLRIGETTLENMVFSATSDNNTLKFSVNSPNRSLAMQASGEIAYKNNYIQNADIRAEIDRFSPTALGLRQNRKGLSYSGRLIAGFSGSSLDDAVGVCTLGSIHLTDSTGSRLLNVNSAVLTASGEKGSRDIKLRSDLVDFDITGSYDVKTIAATFESIAARRFPSLFPESHLLSDASNDFTLNARIKETEVFADSLRLPASLMYPMQISGHIDGSALTASLDIDAPYIRQGNKIIEGTTLHLNCDTTAATLSAHTKVPTKDGLMSINLDNRFGADTLLTSIDWKIDRQREYRGNLGFSTRISRLEDDRLFTRVNILPGEMEFNDTVWTVDHATITAYGKDRFAVDHINASRYGQYVKINGVASASSDDKLRIDLSNVNLDYIFESLGIDKARIGGDATGTFTASALLSPEPHLTTPGLDVKNISYNATVLGDAIVKSRWDGERRAITLNADITQPDGNMSKIDGAIFPLNDSLDISFDAKEINIGFLKPFMEAFTSDVQGRASGKARLWGNFKYIDFEGRLHADSIRMKIDFTNTWYTACDSVIVTPGLIDLKGITLRDEYGNTATLNGYVKHKFFKAPEFEFNITDARHMLVYDETERRNPDWYGRVFANGKAAVKGGPGWVNINADMSTASQSVFTFVLSDMEEAGEYSFITFRDRDMMQVRDSIVMADPTPALVRDMRRKLAQKEEEGTSRYDMDFRVAITPDAQLIIVMDPVGGDRIRAYGSGTIRMQYGSTDEELRMYGTYTLERGSYNFTLQDIIIKDFSIRDGSSIAFTGDPFAAILDITAIYALNANLSDLDESFLQDRDLNRTNVPVHAVLKVAGDLQQPDIAFDLEFPTLPSDTYRKVKSIVSTDEMMNRQIIYLLALSRFYTPDYVGATRGNELVSVASSTLSSQLTNILGQINDKWSIAPNFRSDKGDFSDLEVDLALSSQLLNNRLLFNGNFGYRDNTMNNNQFIGDFDIEYLLNRRGTLRLKAYNRYNDRNYYVKTATTTQGVGIVLRHDFDSFLSFLKKYRKKEVAKNAENPDSTTVILPEVTFPDSIR